MYLWLVGVKREWPARVASDGDGGAFGQIQIDERISQLQGMLLDV